MLIFYVRFAFTLFGSEEKNEIIYNIFYISKEILCMFESVFKVLRYDMKLKSFYERKMYNMTEMTILHSILFQILVHCLHKMLIFNHQKYNKSTIQVQKETEKGKIV